MKKEYTIWNIGSEVRKALLSSEKLSKKVNGAVRPMVVKEGTSFPFIVYQKSGGYYDYTKDGVSGGTMTVDIIVFSDKYEEMCEVCDMVDDAMFDYFNVGKSVAKLIGSDENFQDDVYYQPMTFQFSL